MKVEDPVPILTAINDHQDFLCQFFGLSQGEYLEEFVQRTEASGKDNQGFSQVGKPKLAHEEVVELEVQGRRDVGIRELLERQMDIQSNRLAARFMSSQISGFHDSRASSCRHDKAAPASRDFDRPFCQQECQLAGVLVVAGHVDCRLSAPEKFFTLLFRLIICVGMQTGENLLGIRAILKTSGTKKDDRILDLLTTKSGQWFDVFRKDAQDAPIRTIEERLVLVRHGRGL